MRESESTLEREAAGANGKFKGQHAGGAPVAGKRPGYVKHLDMFATSFFFTNLPEGFKVSELYTIFWRFGKVGEVYVPLKADRYGRRFGFVKFLEVEDEVELGSRLEEAWLGETRLKVQKAKFGRQEKLVQPLLPRRDAAQPLLAKRDVIQGKGVVVQAGRSFTTVVQHGNNATLPVVRRRIVLLPTESRLKALENCFVGKLSFHREAKQVHHCLVLGGLNNIKVTSMGDNLVLLECNNPLLIEEAERRKDLWWRGLFISVNRWLPNMVATHRRIWLRVYGLPMHAWDEQSFKKLGNLFGEFLDFDDESINASRLDMARVLVRTTSLALINEPVSVEVMGAVFNVLVMEEVAPALGSKAEPTVCWEDASVSSNGGGRGGDHGDPSELDEGCSVASSTRAIFERQGDKHGSAEGACVSSKKQQDCAENVAKVGQDSASLFDKNTQTEPLVQRHVAHTTNPPLILYHEGPHVEMEGTKEEFFAGKENVVSHHVEVVPTESNLVFFGPKTIGPVLVSDVANNCDNFTNTAVKVKEVGRVNSHIRFNTEDSDLSESGESVDAVEENLDRKARQKAIRKHKRKQVSGNNLSLSLSNFPYLEMGKNEEKKSFEARSTSLIVGEVEAKGLDDDGSPHSSRVSGTVFTPPSGLKLVLDANLDQDLDTPEVVGGGDPLKKIEASFLYGMQNNLGVSYTTPEVANKDRLEDMDVVDVNKKILRENVMVNQ